MIKGYNVNSIKKNMSNGMKARLLAFLTVLIWATSYMSTKILLRQMESLTLIVVRFFITAVALIIYIVVKKMKLPDVRDIPYFIISGLSGFSLYMIYFNKGVNLVSTGTSSVIIAGAPIFTAVLSSLILKEKINFYSWICIGISFLGIVVLTLWEGVITFNIGIFYLLIPAILMAFYNILQRKLVKKYSAIEATVYSMLAGSLILVFYSPNSLMEVKNMNIWAFLLIIYLALIVGVFGYILWSEAFTFAENVSDVTNFMFLTPFIVTILGILFLNEKLTKPTLIGGLLILLGLIGYSKFKNVKVKTLKWSQSKKSK